MRKLFLALMLSSALCAVAIGGALAWSGSATTTSTATAGQVHATVTNYNGTGVKIVPSNAWQTVANGGLVNDGDVAFHVTGGAVNGFGWSAGNGPSPAACNDNTAGNFVVTNGGTLNPGDNVAGLYSVQVNLDTNAENDCQNSTLSYSVTVNVGT